MEENTALKIRSDLYPMSSLVAYEMTSNSSIRDQNIGSELPFDLRTRTNPDPCGNGDSEPTKSDSHKKSPNYSSTNGDLRHSSPIYETNENHQRTAEIESFSLKCSGQPPNQSNCVIPIASRESCLVFQERERPVKEIGISSPAELMDPGGERTSPITNKNNEDDDDDDDERIDVVTPDEVPVPKGVNSVMSCLTQPYHAPYMAPPEYLLLRNHGSPTSIPPEVPDSLIRSTNGPPATPLRPLDVLTRRLHQGFESYDNTRDLPESSIGTLATAATLDLSTSSRSSSSSDHYNPSAQTPKLPLSPTPSPTLFNPFGVLPNFARLQEMNPMFREGLESALKPTYNPSLYSANLPPHLLPWLISSQIQNLVQCQQTRTEGNRSIFGPYNGSIFTEEKDQQPLDLSAKRIPIAPLSDEDLVSRVLETKPSTRGRRRADNNKRTYTEDELHAALRDIQSGKLGTRRAAVIYGIPRSTLRNKVYKLQMEKDRNKKLMEQNEKAATILPDSTHSGLLTFLSESKTQQGTASCEAFKSIIRSKMTEKLDELSKTKQAFLTGTERQRLLDSSFSYLFENIPKLALNLEKKDPPSEVLSSLSLYPQLNEVTHKIIEERFNEEIKRTKNRINGSLIPNYTSSYKRDPSDDPEISVPSYPVFMSPSSHGDFIREEEKNIFGSSQASMSSPQENLKDMIANMINQKLFNEESTLKRPASNIGPSETFLPISVQRLETSVIKSSQTLSSEERISQEQSKKRAKSPSTNGGGKGSRPKRGKYRNYDRDNLLKAVQAVQTGEMSVHRAGSYYGVPHSTLEYKVKERHLHKNRPKKEANVQSNVQSLLRNSKDPVSALGGTLISNSLAKDQYKTEIPDTTTLDIALTESRPRSNDDISIISVQSSPKKFKHASEKDDRPYSSSLSIPPNPFLSNPFPFWNNASPLLAPFLSNQYQSENLYTSQMMMDLQEKLGNKADSVMKSSPSRMESKFPEYFSRENLLTTKSHHTLSNGGSITPSPPSSPPLNEGLLNTLLRKKIETASNESACHWQIPSESTEQSQDGTKGNVSETNTSQRLSPCQGPPTSFLTLNALLPSFLAARSSIAAAVSLSAENVSEQSPPQPAPMSLIKGVPYIPFVGSHLSEAP